MSQYTLNASYGARHREVVKKREPWSAIPVAVALRVSGGQEMGHLHFCVPYTWHEIGEWREGKAGWLLQ
jgi:hypothetical protein